MFLSILGYFNLVMSPILLIKLYMEREHYRNLLGSLKILSLNDNMKHEVIQKKIKEVVNLI